MYKTINVYDFRDWFTNSDTYKNNFSWEGLAALLTISKSTEESTGEKVEFDPIALCCEYSEYKSAWETMEEYQPEDMPIIEYGRTVKAWTGRTTGTRKRVSGSGPYYRNPLLMAV